MSENIIAASWRIHESTTDKVGCCEEAEVTLSNKNDRMKNCSVNNDLQFL
jgi:hypothetical protein